MTREEKIKAIYEKVADRTLNFGFEFKNKGDIIWNSVMIGDVLDYCIGDKELNSNRLMGQNTIHGLLNRWKEKRLPIESQSDECIDFIFNLIKHEST